ncbi:iron-sulfur cluster biosynthesis family protein [Lacticaseibacillus jixianensis]|uniref:Iron-sulfur cluster biosynthesis family protein n=1 Tax=Lacticaseibacillus jixianensis TaxID=2486012 RepID=A0ABW4BAA9_9LACO|nr:iron-sulfur cluster biosynthesis family protein [Lacticaseibacillus jixianensis]
MEITIKEAAQDYLATKLIPGERLLLALDDGSSKYSKLGGTCAIGNKFQLVIADAPDPDYAEALANNADLNLTTGALELTYLGHGLTMDYRNGMLNLRDDTGILDGAVTIARAQPLAKEEAARREEMKALGGKIC